MDHQVSRRWTTPARLALGAALAFTLFMAWTPHPPQLPIDSLGDKFEHSLAFVILALLAAAAFPAASLFRIGERLSFLGALIEVVQAIPSVHRDCDIMDWLADTIATAAMLMVVQIYRARHRGDGE